MKVLLFIRDLGVGGSQRQLAVLAAGLARRGHDVAVATLYRGGTLEWMLSDSGVRLLPIGKSGRWHVLSPLIRLARLLLAERPDVLYAFLPMQTTLAALLLPPWLKTKLVFGIRAGGMQLENYDRLNALTYRSEAVLARRTDLVIANARAVRADAIARGLPADRIAVVPNGIDTEILRPDADAGRAQRQAWGLPDSAFVVGCVGRLDPMKDHANLLKAAAIFARDHSDARFVCVGDGPDAFRDELKTLARTLGLESRIVWTGEMHDMNKVYSAFDIATLASAFGEGFPNVVGEAMACGRPVAATDVGDVRQIVGAFGEVVAPRSPEALSAAWMRLRQRLEQDRELRAATRNSIVANYGVEAMVRRTETILAQLVTGRPVRDIVHEFQ
jgi:glycosyltransferase involved in cell wall biosynthesis